MATITVTVAGYTCSMDVPTEAQLIAADSADLMIATAKAEFVDIADDALLDTAERENKLAAISALMLKMLQLRAANVPALELTPAP
jgi:hypothetical protein